MPDETRDTIAGDWIDFVGEMGETFGYTLTGPTRLGDLTAAQQRVYGEYLRRDAERERQAQEDADAAAQADGPLDRSRPKGKPRESDLAMLEAVDAELREHD